MVGKVNKSELPELERSKFLFPATAKGQLTQASCLAKLWMQEARRKDWGHFTCSEAKPFLMHCYYTRLMTFKKLYCIVLHTMLCKKLGWGPDWQLI